MHFAVVIGRLQELVKPNLLINLPWWPSKFLDQTPCAGVIFNDDRPMISPPLEASSVHDSLQKGANLYRWRLLGSGSYDPQHFICGAKDLLLSLGLKGVCRTAQPVRVFVPMLGLTHVNL